MKMTPSQPQQNLADRLGPAHVGLRPDLETHRHLFQGIPCYVIRDPITLQCHRVNKMEYEILVHLTSKHSLSETFDYLVSVGKLKQENEEEFYKFVVSLHQLAFLNLPLSDNKALYRRFLAKQNAKRKEKLMGFLFLRIPLINPDIFLNKGSYLAKHLFSRWFFLIWLVLMAVGGSIVILKRNDLFAPLGGMFTARNIICMWVALILLKVFHEFGHAFACKSRGGYVPEMGVYLIALTPCAYVDVTSSWSFTRKRDRLIVGLAGVYIESMIAVIALLVWVNSKSASINTIAHNVFFLSSVMTLVMNINPLMRFDGYYILSDLLEIPNLRQQAQQYVIRVIKRIFLGLKIPDLPYRKIMLIILFAFGVASSLYKVIVILSISALLATKFFLVGLFMGAFYLGTTLIGILRRVTMYLWKSPESAPVRVRAVIYSLILLIGIPAAIFCLPIPSYIRTSGQLVREHDHVIYAQYDGFVGDINAVSGDMVTTGMQLAKLENTQMEQECRQIQALLQKAQIQLNALRNDKTNNNLAIEQEKIIKSLQSELQFRQAELAKLNVRTDVDGMIVTGLDHNSIGRYVKQAEPLANIVSGRWVAKVLLTEQEIAEAQPNVGQEVRLQFLARPESVLLGKIIRISPGGSRRIDLPALTTLGQGNIMVHPATLEAAVPYYELTIIIADSDTDYLRYGMTGRVKLKTAAKPIGASVIHKLFRFINNLKRE